ncbi:DUF3662 and FHA domain-containing protein [Rhabdothermincola sp.]|uniref:DUF3662 and FHA domain-containing protein n=1 Tax=Rhabdothermincola sp. TaxID=2820405 RepID=UPI002FE2A715
MGLKGFERKLENLVEGAFARMFRSGLRPIELGRRLARELDDNRSVDVRGRTVVPNDFTIALSPEDHERFADIEDTLCRELCDAAREHARDESYSFLGPVAVELTVDPALRTGTFTIVSRMKEGPSGVGAGSLLLPNGERYVLDEHPVLIGRLDECDITILDANVSRRHAEIRPRGDGFVVIDLGSTNGTRVNGVPVSERELRDGDELTVGNTRIGFQAS